jgi:hypothetical protein
VSPPLSLVRSTGVDLHQFGFFLLFGAWRIYSFSSTWAVIVFWPTWPFDFFTVFLLADMTHARIGLVRYFLVSTAFTVPINSTGSGLIYTDLELSLSVSLLVVVSRLEASLLHGSH